ncbi:50S ribosomal protein L7 [Ureibacillus massiliensis 4400831 = CIP 108448 = CCUG 49529]|uniref:50S ribosomal protein L7 n=1 Tax=Ureibacillus massiliensis 4400831 = CIP 108448 = CCUG 49529 TaxID=1211035 RepID=A0A0A3JYF6_9BACL|nr:YlxQ family RNA-binding protein [Ureibacillus massiliensis]KGR92037.1 50S ribosomal protein L7 [Ureibacillus massiliensis 4400831 = CIP 108448 = CCUG 49529]
MINEKLFQLLGLAARARKIISGEELVVKAIQTGNAKLILLASDASHNSTKKIQDKCTYYNVEYHVIGDRYQLGHATGKQARVALAIVDSGFAKKMSSLLNEK